MIGALFDRLNWWMACPWWEELKSKSVNETLSVNRVDSNMVGRGLDRLRIQ